MRMLHYFIAELSKGVFLIEQKKWLFADSRLVEVSRLIEILFGRGLVLNGVLFLIAVFVEIVVFFEGVWNGIVFERPGFEGATLLLLESLVLESGVFNVAQIGQSAVFSMHDHVWA